MDPSRFDRDPREPLPTPSLDPPVQLPGAVAHAASADAALNPENEKEEERPLEEPGYGHGV
jgi:hypothetical protein